MGDMTWKLMFVSCLQGQPPYGGYGPGYPPQQGSYGQPPYPYGPPPYAPAPGYYPQAAYGELIPAFFCLRYVRTAASVITRIRSQCAGLDNMYLPPY